MILKVDIQSIKLIIDTFLSYFAFIYLIKSKNVFLLYQNKLSSWFYQKEIYEFNKNKNLSK